MNVSLKWLGTLVDIKGMNPDDMAETLTVDGIPVEHVIRPGEGIKGVITGKILSVEKHPDADHLLICSWMWVRKNRCRLLPVLPM
mgnify:CR=1 FL=1